MKTHLRVLVIEDSEEEIVRLAEELGRGGYEPTLRQVQRREEMEEALGESKWDLVISEYRLSLFGAEEALELLRQRGLDIPLIVVSEKVGEETVVTLMRSGARDFVPADALYRLAPAVKRELQEAEDRREREAAESELRRSEELYRAVVEQATEAIFLVNIEDLRVLDSNPAFRRMLGYTPEELSGITIYDIAAHSSESVDANTEHVLREGHYRVGERRYRHKDGSLVDVEVSASTTSFQEEGVVSIIVAHDITERKRTEERLRQSLNALMAVYEAGQLLSSTLEAEEIGTRLLQLMQRISTLSTAVISTPEEGEELRVWRAIGFDNLWRKARYTPRVQEVLWEVMQSGEHRVLELDPPEDSEFDSLRGTFLPLRIRGGIIGVLEVYGPEDMADREMMNILLSLTSKAASALENARLYGELDRRRGQLQELVNRMIVTQEEERRRVAYEVHDGPAQVAVAAYQHIQAFANLYSPESPEAKELLENAVEFARKTVGESRQIISDLRPTVLDDFGLAVALRSQVEALQKEGWWVNYRENLGEQRLPEAVETTLYRVAQETMTNVRKHASTRRIHVTLRKFDERVRLRVRDHGTGLDPDRTSNTGPGEQVGLAGMRERMSLVGGKLELYGKKGSGTLAVAEISLGGQGEGVVIEP